MIQVRMSEVEYAVLMLVLFTLFTVLYGYTVLRLRSELVVVLGIVVGLVGIGYNLFILWSLFRE